MNLIDENVEKESEEKQKKVTKIIIIAIAVLVALVILILLYSVIKKKNTLTVTVNDEKRSFNSSLFLMQDKKHFRKSESGEIYISVRELTNVLNSGIEDNDQRRVAYFNDEYKGKGEDVTKCHIKTENEYTSYISGSSTIYKVRDNKAANDEQREKNKSNKDNEEELLVSDFEYEYFSIDGGVICENNEIYATQSAIELGFNVKILVDEKNKSVKIYTLDGLSNVASGVIGATVVTDNIDYYNKKLLKHGYALVRSSSGDYGIQDYNSYQEGNYVLSCKYSDIKYIEALSCLIVTTSDKNEKGILKLNIDTAEVETLVDPVYQEINQITDDGSLYVIKQSDKYGLLKIQDGKAETVLKCEYQTVGISNYSEYEEMENRYLIDNKYIPVKRDNKWGIATIEGKLSIVPQYDEIGCNLGEGGKPAICIPNLKNGVAAIIFGVIPANPDPNAVPNNNNNNNEAVKYTYSIVNAETKQKIGFDAAEIYSTYINNEREYVMKIVATDGSTHRINIYDAYSEPARTKKVNATSNNDNNNNNNNNNNTTTNNNNNTTTNNNNNTSN